MLGQALKNLETDFASDGVVALSAMTCKPYLHQIRPLIHLHAVEEWQHNLRHDVQAILLPIPQSYGQGPAHTFTWSSKPMVKVPAGP